MSALNRENAAELNGPTPPSVADQVTPVPVSQSNTLYVK